MAIQLPISDKFSASTRQFMTITLLILVFVTLSAMINVCDARKRSKPPLIEEPSRRRAVRPTHCPFGNQSYEIEERWRPNLQPFGVFYCIRCECIAVQRKNRIVAKVRCKNIKNECPEPLCDNPVLRPERCCKTCPGEDTPYEDLPEKSRSDVMLNTSISDNYKEINNSLQRSYLEDSNVIGEPTHKCYYEAEIYDDGTQWKAQYDDCEMCMCQRGRVKCEHELCPKLNCSNSTTVHGSCCPLCPNQIEAFNSSTTKKGGCFFDGDKKFHVSGSRWHPYIPPFGFDKCSLCTCLTDTETIKCERNTNCPPLTCPEQEAYRENPMDCCKRCPNLPPVKAIVTLDQLGDQRGSGGGLIKSPNDLLAAGGCKFKGRVFLNGDEWHPTVQPFGEVKCIKCHCKDGNHKCKRISCPKITACSIVISKNNECCPICADNDDFMMRNIPTVVHNTRRGARRRKGRRSHRRAHRRAQRQQQILSVTQ